MLAGTAAMAQPTTQPGPGLGARRGPLGRGGRATTPAEAQQAINWAQEHMPNLSKLIAQTSRGRGRPMMPLINIAWRNMRAVEQAPPDSPARENMLKVTNEEDNIIPLLVELRQAADENKPAVREKIRMQMRLAVDGALSDREKRIAKLRERLDQEQQQLDQDRSNIDQIVAQRLQPFVNASNLMSNEDQPTTEPSNAMEPVHNDP
jgi:flagellar biosynthesis/type III secretory pathway chaperone